MRRALVTGITGHLGRELARQLSAAGVDVHGLTRQSAAVNDSAAPVGQLHLVDGSTETLVKLFAEINPHTVFHLAALSRREHQPCDIEPFIEANLLFGTQLLEAMRQTQCPRLITAGSYLQRFGPDGTRSLNLYAATKEAFEDLVEYFADAYGISAACLYLCDIYSETDTRPKLMTDIARAWAENRPLTLRNDEVWLDLLHVEDVAAAFLHAEHPLDSGSLPAGHIGRYSVTSGRDVSATELVSLFERLGGRKLIVNRDTSLRSSRTMRPWRGPTLPGWSPRVSIEEGVGRFVTRSP